MPIRIQRKRVKGWKMPENTVYVGRGTKWGNPFVLAHPDSKLSRQEVIDAFKIYILKKIEIGEVNISELNGKNLSCFCPLDKPCHADVLLKLANAQPI